MADTNAIPRTYHTVTPSLIVRGGATAIDFYKRALGAEQVMRIDAPDGKVMHAELKIGNSVVMLTDENPQWQCVGPQTLGNTSVSFYVYVENVDAAYKRVVDAGAKSIMPVTDMFWGDRMGAVLDPFGHKWSLAQHTKDMTEEEIKRGQKEWMEKMAQKK
jgi:uncharacterized glyoxalase superfamily protein PhnB